MLVAAPTVVHIYQPNITAIWLEEMDVLLSLQWSSCILPSRTFPRRLLSCRSRSPTVDIDLISATNSHLSVDSVDSVDGGRPSTVRACGNHILDSVSIRHQPPFPHLHPFPRFFSRAGRGVVFSQ